jgi:sugar lactone lactonase YvrE
LPDRGNNTIRRITPGGVVTTFAGTAGVQGSTDGTGAAASFFAPVSTAVDSAGNVYVGDTQNSTIRKITPAGVVTTLAGTAGVIGSADGTGPAAQFSGIEGLTIDGAGNLYALDTNAIRKITPAGVVTTLAGVAGANGSAGSADGTGAAAQFFGPMGIAADGAGNLYVTDTKNDTIRKVTPIGIVTTLAGTPDKNGSADGMGAAAQFSQPDGIACDSAGNLYVADFDNETVRKITPNGLVTTIVGQPGVIGFSPGNLPGALTSPFGIALFGSTLYVTTASAVAQVTNVP